MDLSDFASSFSSPEPPLLASLRTATWQRTRHGRLMSDVHTGRVLAMISRMARPSIALELGTFTGYGTLCLLEGVKPDGVLHTVERNDELFAMQDEFWSKAEGGQRIVRHHADVLDMMSAWKVDQDGPVELAYVDADKQHVNAQLDALLPLMARGGWMVFDNTWWNGTLDGPDAAAGPKPDALRSLNERLRSGASWHTTVIPVGDGVTVVQTA